jgi:hypothetical protein
MTCRTLNRTGTAFFVAAFTLAVNGIGNRDIAVSRVAFTTGHRLLAFVVALIARNAISLVGRMGLMIKEHFSCRGLEHESYGFFRDLLGESRVADHAYDKQDSCQGKCQ